MLSIEDVEQFHKAFGHPIGDPKRFAALIADYDTHNTSDNALIQLRMKLIYEEADELAEGFAHGDPSEVADALFDLLYVTYGAIIALGVPRDIGDIVHKSNMSKGVECSACKGSCIEEVYGGHGNVLELPCSVCKGTGIVPILREDGKVLKGPNWIDDKPLIAAEIERVCRDWDKDADDVHGESTQ